MGKKRSGINDNGRGAAESILGEILQLRDSRVSSAIIGASRPEQVADNAAASGIKLSDDV
ncbi:aldo/keto reductase [Calothrix sp. NIES-4071]|nr:aldo/keto reductase [Calothrix sp. NIES-4071]BAZ60237.1 aldo/keto reductase [Calothrix sp. NIES-4105]